MRIKKGTEVLVKAIIEEDCLDALPLEARGYLVRTNRGTVRVNPNEILSVPVCDNEDLDRKL